ncbi:MAG: sigma-70 family RNA polymerase sigma factor, partial [Myxococcota bacterium]
ETLPPKLRIVLVLYDVEGQTMKEIGAVLGRPLPTIQSQLKAARTKLAEALLDTGSESKAHTEDAEGRR